MTVAGDERECWCGATITAVDLPSDLAELDGRPFVWVSDKGQTHCYPNEDTADREARHEPCD